MTATLASVLEQACADHPGVWAEQKLGYVNDAVHWEWYELGLRFPRLCIVAPREHAKTTCLSVNQTAHGALYRPGLWQYVFSATMQQSTLILERVCEAIVHVEPRQVDRARRFTTTDVILANGSRITVGSVGKSVRGIHPDRVVGDDILEESSTQTSYQRTQIERWWLGTVGPMAHPGAERLIGGRTVRFPPTRITLVGTPFHQLDLLMSMRDNPVYTFRRYAAEFDRADLVDGLAVEAA